jgi:hypothetical protein
MGIVDEDEQAVGFGAGGQCGDDLAGQRQLCAFEIVCPLSEGAERDRATGGGGSGASEGPPGVGRCLDRLASQP